MEKAGKLSSGDQLPSTKRLYFQQVTEENIKTKTVNLSILNRQQNQRVTSLSHFFQMRLLVGKRACETLISNR